MAECRVPAELDLNGNIAENFKKFKQNFEIYLLASDKHQKSSELCAFSTFNGCYKFNRAPFGLKPLPELFQKRLDESFGDIKGVVIYFDDILIAANSEKEHDIILEQVLQRAKKLNVKFNPDKFQFKTDHVKFLGHVFCKEGMKPDLDRVKAINCVENPKNLKELQRLMGMLNYLRRFIPNYSEIIAPLCNMLRKNVEFQWLPHHTEALNKVKSILASDVALGNFDEKSETEIQTDASQSGIGSCLLQNGKPVYHASRSMTDSEKNFSQIEKEMLAVVYSVKKFHNFIYGRKIKIFTDHKPLVSIMKKEISKIASARIQRMRIKLLKYDINLVYLPGPKMHIADLYSRSYCKDQVEDDKELIEIVHLVDKYLNITDEKRKEFQSETKNDVLLTTLIKYVENGWPSSVKTIPLNLKVYWPYKSNIQFINGLLFMDERIIVPQSLVPEMLIKLHEAHFGITKTLLKAKSCMYWPNMVQDIQRFISKCKICEMFRAKNCKEPMLSHEIPNRPFQKIASDICEFEGCFYLIVFDYFSKWLEIVKLKNKTASEVIRILKLIFSTHGVPDEFISDNVPYNSYEFRRFAEDWNFKIITSSPRYPRSNGLAEKGVGIAKQMLKKCKDLPLGLLEYRTTPVVGIGLSPSELLMNRRLKTKLPITESSLKPKITNNDIVKRLIEDKKQRDKYFYDQNSKPRYPFVKDENIVIREGNKWVAGKIVDTCIQPRSYTVSDSHGNLYRRNSSFLRKSENDCKIQTDINDKMYIPSTEAPQASINKTTESRSDRVRHLPNRFKDFHMY